MGKLLCVFLILPILFCSQASVISDLFCEADSVEIYKDGQIYSLTNEQEQEFDKIFCNIMEGATQKPAFAVSVDELTKEELKTGYWVKFIFNETIFKSNMPFDELLIKVTQNASGVNIIRGNNGDYQGRCYYLDLSNTMDLLYDFISELPIEEQNDIEFELESQEIKETMIVREEDMQNNNSDDNNNLNSDINDKETKTDSFYDDKEKEVEEGMTKSQKELLEHLS